MSTSLPSLMKSKKQVPGKREFNAANILADLMPAAETPKSFYRETFQGEPVNNKVLPAGRSNKANLTSVCFLYENPRFVNEPVCYANTKATDSKQGNWWPDAVVKEKKITGEYNTSTVSRSDYKYISERAVRATRFGFTPHRGYITKGIVPVDKDPNPPNERIKFPFQHEYNCRSGRRERGKLHGSFV